MIGKSVLLGAMLSLPALVVAQSSYKPGYLISETGDSVVVEILDRCWVDNPTSFRYRLPDDDNTRTATLADVRGFGFADGSQRYQRFAVDIDRSSVRDASLSSSDTPEFERATVYLEYLVDGKADLFSWESGEQRNFFYRLDEAQPQPLISRRYREGSAGIRRDDSFRGTLKSNVDCPGNFTQIELLEYRRSDLIRYFEEYNRCAGGDPIVFDRAPASGKFSIGIRVGADHARAALGRTNSFGVTTSTEVPTKLGLHAGVELEYRLPFANNRWATIAESHYNRYRSGTDESQPRFASLNFQSFSQSLGLRRYFYVFGDHSLYLNASVTLIFPHRSTISFGINGTGSALEPNFSQGLTFGGGISISNRFQLEARHALERNLTDRHPDNPARYSSVSAILCYRFGRKLE